MIAALPPHDECEAELKRLKNVPEETIREDLVKAHEIIRQQEKRILDLEGELNDVNIYNISEEGSDGDGNGLFYLRLADHGEACAEITSRVVSLAGQLSLVALSS